MHCDKIFEAYDQADRDSRSERKVVSDLLREQMASRESEIKWMQKLLSTLEWVDSFDNWSE